MSPASSLDRFAVVANARAALEEVDDVVFLAAAAAARVERSGRSSVEGNRATMAEDVYGRGGRGDGVAGLV